MSQTEYFALKCELSELLDKVDKFRKQLDRLGHAAKIARSFAQYYGRGYDARSDKLTASGEQGEESRISVNKYRSLLRYQLSIITSERPATHVTPINTDYQSVTSAIVGEQVLDYYMKAKDLENVLFDAIEKAVWSSEGYVGLSWATEDGEFFGVDPDNQELIMSGDVKFTTYAANEVIRDIRQKHPQWYILTERVNKWDLAAKFPEKEQEILNSGIDGQSKPYGYGSLYSDGSDEDYVSLYTFYHKRSPALPEGRLVLFTDATKIIDMALPYQHMPVYRVAAADLHTTNLGYTQGFDLLALQEATDELYSATISNNINFSRQCIVLPRNADINYRDLTDGFAVIEVDAEEAAAIRPLQLTNSAPETYSLIDRLDKEMEGLTGINEVVRGNPGPNVRAASAMALLSAQAIKYNSTLQQSYIKLIEDVCTSTLNFLKDFAVAPRFIEVVDKSQRSYLREFSKDDLSGISRVQVETVSALSKTQAGRIEIANNLLQNGMIKRPEQYIAVLTTGKLEPLIQAEQSELLNIQAENEALASGENPISLLTDNHALHIREHRTVLDNPDARKDPNVTNAALQHIQEHLDLWSSADPNVLMATGQAPMQMPMPPQDQGNMGVSPDTMGPTQASETAGIPDVNAPGLPPTASPEDQAAFDQTLV
jgi:hypothetical protein